MLKSNCYSIAVPFPILFLAHARTVFQDRPRRGLLGHAAQKGPRKDSLAALGTLHRPKRRSGAVRGDRNRVARERCRGRGNAVPARGPARAHEPGRDCGAAENGVAGPSPRAARAARADARFVRQEAVHRDARGSQRLGKDDLDRQARKVLPGPRSLGAARRRGHLSRRGARAARRLGREKCRRGRRPVGRRSGSGRVRCHRRGALARNRRGPRRYGRAVAHAAAPHGGDRQDQTSHRQGRTRRATRGMARARRQHGPERPQTGPGLRRRARPHGTDSHQARRHCKGRYRMRHRAGAIAASAAAQIRGRRRRDSRSAPIRRRRFRFGASRLTDGVAIISLRQVSKRYPGGFEALKAVSFAVEPGEMLFLTGHSGAGKTTLLKLIAAIERANGGAVLVNGQNLSALRPAAIPYLRRNLGLVFQGQKLLFDRSVFDNVMLPLIVTGQPYREAARRARAALDKVGLLQREKANPVTLSGGEQQRLCVARAVVNRPAILLADEPTASLDAAYADEIMEMFSAFNQVGVTVLVATHDRQLIGKYRKRVLTLDHGKLLQ